MWARFKELLDDEYIISSAALNPQYALRILKRKKSTTAKTFNQPDIKLAIPVFIKIFKKFGSIVEVEDNLEPLSSSEEDILLLVASDTTDAILKKTFKDEYKIFMTFTYEQDVSTVKQHTSDVVNKWWYDHRFEIPHLYVVATALLTIKPTSVECESVFSKSSRFMSKGGCAMEPTTMDNCVFLYNNMDLFLNALKDRSIAWKMAMKSEDIVIIDSDE